MSEIFLSYASADRNKAKALAEFLQAHSCSVFWDRTVPPGHSWDDVIERALQEARVVIVLWSKAAVNSDWVKAEAGDAAARRILVPAMIEKVDLPLRFRSIQAADLITWDLGSTTGEIIALLSAIEELLGRKFFAVDSHKEFHTDQLGTQPISVKGTRSPRAFGSSVRGSVLKALGYHLILGIGLFYVDPRLKRRWVYVSLPTYSIVDIVLGPGLDIEPFKSDPGFVTFVGALVLYGLSFIDVGYTCYRRLIANRAA